MPWTRSSAASRRLIPTRSSRCRSPSMPIRCHRMRQLPYCRSRTRESIMAAKPEDTLIIDTSKGRVVVALRPDLAPNHVARIKELARQGFYDGVPFHRVIKGFMAQTGDPTGTGTGGSGQKLPAEFNAEPHTRGAVSMARAQSPDSADSQFFIVFDDATFLDRKYTLWGRVIEGMENVDAINKGEPPASPDKIVSAKISADA